MSGGHFGLALDFGGPRPAPARLVLWGGRECDRQYGSPEDIAQVRRDYREASLNRMLLELRLAGERVAQTIGASMLALAADIEQAVTSGGIRGGAVVYGEGDEPC